MTTTEGNRLIAEFMGVEPKNWNPSHKKTDYDNSWDMLMPVVDSISNLQMADINSPGDSVEIRIEIQYPNCEINGGGYWSADEDGWNELLFEFNSFWEAKVKGIDAIYYCVVKFIEWYNKTKKS